MTDPPPTPAPTQPAAAPGPTGDPNVSLWAMMGVIILAGSIYNLVHGAIAGGGIVVSRSDLKRGAALFLPAAAFIGAIPWFGFYLASGAYMFGVLAIPRHLTLVRSLLVGVVTPIALYVVFERVFQVSLPHGAFAAALGY